MLPVLVHYEHNSLQFGVIGEEKFSGEIPCQVGRSKLTRKNSIDYLGGSASNSQQLFLQKNFSDEMSPENDPDDPASVLIIGNQNNNLRNAILKYSQPVRSNGRIDNFAEYEKLIEYGLKFELNKETLSDEWLENGVLVTEWSFQKKQRERLCELMLESFEFDKFGVRNAAALKLIGAAEDLNASGLVLDRFNLIPVYEGYAINEATVSSEDHPEFQIGGDAEGFELSNVDNLVQHSTKALASDVSELLFAKIYYTAAGNQQQQNQKVAGSLKFNLKEIHQADNLVWKGAGCAFLDDWDIFNAFVTRDEYYEIGEQIVNRKTWA
jgi:hypothetical protein